jgi:hypothetical protein
VLFDVRDQHLRGTQQEFTFLPNEISQGIGGMSQRFFFESVGRDSFGIHSRDSTTITFPV